MFASIVVDSEAIRLGISLNLKIAIIVVVRADVIVHEMRSVEQKVRITASTASLTPLPVTAITTITITITIRAATTKTTTVYDCRSAMKNQ